MTIASSKITALSTISEADKYTYSVAPFAVKASDARLLASLGNVIRNSDLYDDLMEESKGSGRELARLLKKVMDTADGRARAVITNEYNNVIRNGIGSELTIDSLKAYSTSYKSVVRNMHPDSRPKAETELEMWNTMRTA